MQGGEEHIAGKIDVFISRVGPGRDLGLVVPDIVIVQQLRELLDIAVLVTLEKIAYHDFRRGRLGIARFWRLFRLCRIVRAAESKKHRRQKNKRPLSSQS